MALIDDIRENYPQYAWAVSDPELGPLLRQAVDPSQAFSPTRFRAKLMATNWWRRRTESQRAWEIKIHTDPGSANQDRSSFTRQLRDLANKLGVNLTHAEFRFIAESALAKGLSVNDPEILHGMRRIYQQKSRQTTGTFAAARQLVSGLARNEYFVGMTDRDAFDLGTSLAMNIETEEGIREELSRRAMSRYPHLAAELRSGKTMRSLFDGHIATIAEELELDPDTINLMDAKWNKVLDTYDPSNKQHRAATLSETMSMARRDDRFWKTQNGQAMGAQLSGYLLDAFGMR